MVKPGGESVTVLVVDDEPAIADVLTLYLQREGFSVRVATTGPEALEAVRAWRPSAVILDVGLPGMDGTDVCRRMRAADDWTPVLFCTARDDEVDRVLGLEMGGDDYITKPFSPREVVARVKVALRHSRGSAATNDLLRVGRVSLDRGARRVFVDEEPIELTATEFDLLAYLMENVGRVLDRDRLLEEVWGYSAAAGTRTVDVHVAQLRAKLGEASPLRTVRGVGYSAEGSAPR